MKTATYFKPVSAPLTVTYHPDGKTPYPYWNIIFRPAGAINASAEDMAAYVRFYLNHGDVGGTKVVTAVSIDRMELPTRSWAAQDGLKYGYGLSSYNAVLDGFVYQGHSGGIDGDLTEMFYLPDYGVGYFYSINATNIVAFKRAGEAIRAYITRGLEKPALPPVAMLPETTFTYAGWYQPDSPRVEHLHFIERLLGITLVRFVDGKLFFSNLFERNGVLVPITGTQFRNVPESGLPAPYATAELLRPNDEGQFIQMERGLTMKRIPAWLAVSELFLAFWFGLAILSVMVYAPIWIIGDLFIKRRPAERSIRLWPLIAVVSFLAIVILILISASDINVPPGKHNRVVSRHISGHFGLCRVFGNRCHRLVASAEARGPQECPPLFGRGGHDTANCCLLPCLLGMDWHPYLGLAHRFL